MAGRSLLKMSPLRRLFVSNPVQSFHPDSPMLKLRGADSTTPRPYRGLDMEKIHSFKLKAVWNPPPQKLVTGFQGPLLNLPSVNAMNDQEIAGFFETDNYHKRLTWAELYDYAKKPFGFILYFNGMFFLCLVPFVLYCWYLYIWEPVEVLMDEDEFFKDFKWNYYGGHLDHHNYQMYLEARRGVKWRGLEVDPRDWIPEEYKESQ